MKKYLFALFIFQYIFIISAQAQFEDQKIKKLAKQLTHKATSDRQKVDSIFYWITDHIAYDMQTAKKPDYSRYPDFGISTNQDSATFYKKYNLAVVNMVLQNKKAICDGYSRLFKTLCDYAEVEAVVVIGAVKLGFSAEKIDVHAWNAVKINNKWHLLDVTWASGTGLGDTFIKKRRLLYYLTPPAQLILNHFPEDRRWTLLDKKYTSQEFLESPGVSPAMTDFFPKKRLIKVKKNELIKITVHSQSIDQLGGVLILEKDMETKATRLKDKYTESQLDSMIKTDPNMMVRIPKFEIIKTQQDAQKVTYFIKPLNNRLQGLILTSYAVGILLKYDVVVTQ